MEKLTRLTALDLGNNQISDGRFLGKVTQLIALDLTDNQISDGRFLGKVTGLTKIELSDNQLTDLEPLRYFFTEKELQVVWKEWYETSEGEINVHGNPLQNPPVEIVQQGNEDCRRSGEQFSAHIWDFGGQEIQYTTHQFFLTPGAVYVLVADDRKQHTLFPYWFEAIRLLGKDDIYGHSPVLVVLNERNNKSITNFDHVEYRRRYPDMQIQVCEVDLCDTNPLRFRQLRERVQEALCHLPHVGRPLPAKWPRIREDLLTLKNEGRNYWSLSEFGEVCARHRVIREDDLALISLYLHRLGQQGQSEMPVSLPFYAERHHYAADCAPAPPY